MSNSYCKSRSYQWNRTGLVPSEGSSTGNCLECSSIWQSRGRCLALAGIRLRPRIPSVRQKRDLGKPGTRFDIHTSAWNISIHSFIHPANIFQYSNILSNKVLPPWFVDAGGVLSTFVSPQFALIHVLFTVLSRPSIGARAVVWGHTPATILTAARAQSCKNLILSFCKTPQKTKSCLGLTKTEASVTGEALLASAIESAGASKCAGGVLVTCVVGSQAQVDRLAQDLVPCQMLGFVTLHALACGIRKMFKKENIFTHKKVIEILHS